MKKVSFRILSILLAIILILSNSASAQTWTSKYTKDGRVYMEFPTGNHIAFASPDANPGTWEIFTTQSTYGVTNHLGLQAPAYEERYYDGDNFRPVWSPDGLKIAYTGADSPSKTMSKIYTMNADGTLRGPLTDDYPSDGYMDIAGGWSQDGKKFIFSRLPDMYGRGGTIRIVNSGGGRSSSIFPEYMPDEYAYWSGNYNFYTPMGIYSMYDSDHLNDYEYFLYHYRMPQLPKYTINRSEREVLVPQPFIDGKEPPLNPGDILWMGAKDPVFIGNNRIAFAIPHRDVYCLADWYDCHFKYEHEYGLWGKWSYVSLVPDSQIDPKNPDPEIYSGKLPLLEKVYDRAAIYGLNIGEKDPFILAQCPSDEYIRASQPAISPDMRYLAFRAERYKYENFDEIMGFDREMALSPREVIGEIFVKDLVTGTLELVSDPFIDCESPSWSPDGEKLLYLEKGNEYRYVTAEKNRSWETSPSAIWNPTLDPSSTGGQFYYDGIYHVSWQPVGNWTIKASYTEKLSGIAKENGEFYAFDLDIGLYNEKGGVPSSLPVIERTKGDSGMEIIRQASSDKNSNSYKIFYPRYYTENEIIFAIREPYGSTHTIGFVFPQRERIVVEASPDVLKEENSYTTRITAYMADSQGKPVDKKQKITLKVNEPGFFPEAGDKREIVMEGSRISTTLKVDAINIKDNSITGSDSVFISAETPDNLSGGLRVFIGGILVTGKVCHRDGEGYETGIPNVPVHIESTGKDKKQYTTQTLSDGTYTVKVSSTAPLMIKADAGSLYTRGGLDKAVEFNIQNANISEKDNNLVAEADTIYVVRREVIEHAQNSVTRYYDRRKKLFPEKNSLASQFINADSSIAEPGGALMDYIQTIETAATHKKHEEEALRRLILALETANIAVDYGNNPFSQYASDEFFDLMSFTMNGMLEYTKSLNLAENLKSYIMDNRGKYANAADAVVRFEETIKTIHNAMEKYEDTLLNQYMSIMKRIGYNRFMMEYTVKDGSSIKLVCNIDQLYKEIIKILNDTTNNAIKEELNKDEFIKNRGKDLEKLMDQINLPKIYEDEMKSALKAAFSLSFSAKIEEGLAEALDCAIKGDNIGFDLDGYGIALNDVRIINQWLKDERAAFESTAGNYQMVEEFFNGAKSSYKNWGKHAIAAVTAGQAIPVLEKIDKILDALVYVEQVAKTGYLWSVFENYLFIDSRWNNKVQSGILQAFDRSVTGSARRIEGASNWAVNELEQALKYNLIPDRLLDNYTSNITRVEFCEAAVKLYEALTGGVMPPPDKNPFTDTSNASVLKAYSLGIVSGTGGNRFSPDNLITRQEICVIFYNVIKAAFPAKNILVEQEHIFADEKDISHWASAQVKLLHKEGIITHTGGNMFSPLSNASREQAIILIKRVYEKYGK